MLNVHIKNVQGPNKFIRVDSDFFFSDVFFLHHLMGKQVRSEYNLPVKKFFCVFPPIELRYYVITIILENTSE